jgi:hypothetical protein
MDGLMKHAVSNATNLVVGEVQVHAPGYLADHSIYKALAEPDLIFQAAKQKNLSAAIRRYGYGLVAVVHNIWTRVAFYRRHHSAA